MAKSLKRKRADVAELVDARDLKSAAAAAIIEVSIKIRSIKPEQMGSAPHRLQNNLR